MPQAMKDITRGEVMEAVMKGALMGIAVGGLTSAVVAINKTVVQKLLEFNCIAVGIVVGMAKVTVRLVTST